MANKTLIVVDMQNDFVTGALANQTALEVIPNIKREIESGKYDHIIFTRDTHQENYLETQEGKNLPVKHCIQNTWGWEIVSELQFNGENIHFVDKPTFGYKNWYEFITNIVGIDGLPKSTKSRRCTKKAFSNLNLCKCSFRKEKIVSLLCKN